MSLTNSWVEKYFLCQHENIAENPQKACKKKVYSDSHTPVLWCSVQEDYYDILIASLAPHPTGNTFHGCRVSRKSNGITQYANLASTDIHSSTQTPVCLYHTHMQQKMHTYRQTFTHAHAHRKSIFTYLPKYMFSKMKYMQLSIQPGSLTKRQINVNKVAWWQM